MRPSYSDCFDSTFIPQRLLEEEHETETKNVLESTQQQTPHKQYEK